MNVQGLEQRFPVVWWFDASDALVSFLMFSPQ